MLRIMDKRLLELTENKITKKCRIETPNPGETVAENDLVPAAADSIPSDFLPEDHMISKLPLELLEHIFEFLPLRDRRNASLVCTAWHEIGNLRKFSLNEKLVFCGYENFERLLRFLSQTKREFLNLEFHDCEFHDCEIHDCEIHHCEFFDPSILSISEKILSLSFKDCLLDDDLLILLFLKCCNLKEFHFYPKEPYNILWFIIAPLEKHGFVNKNLDILDLNIDGFYLSDDEQMDSLFNMFPNITNLPFIKLSRRNRDPLNFSDDYSFSLALGIISKQHTLETLDTFGYENHLQLLELHNFPRLKRLSFLIRIMMSVPDNYSYFNFIIQLEYLETLSLHIIDDRSYRMDLTRQITYLIRRCLNLKHLKLLAKIFIIDLDLSLELLQALVSSNLISFVTDMSLFIRFAYDCDPSLENRTLRILRFQSFSSSSVLPYFLQRFKNLKSLELSNFHEINLELIGQFQKKLTSFRFKSHLSYRNDFTSRRNVYEALSYSLRSLTSLESLDLSLADNGLLFDCDLVPPSVKYLRLSLSTTCEFGIEILKQSLLALKNIRGLEAIYFKSKCPDVLDRNIWLEICSSLKKLRIVCLQTSDSHSWNASNSGNWFSSDVKQFLECCPSLRYFVLKAVPRVILCFYDQVDGRHKVKEKVDPMMTDDFIFTEVIKGCKIKLSDMHPFSEMPQN